MIAMRWIPWVGLRYLKSKKNSRFLSFITLLSVMGVGVGVTALIVVLSVMDGFEAQMKRRLFTSDLHVLVQPKPELMGTAGIDSQGWVENAELSAEKIAELRKKEPAVVNFWPVISAEAILRHARKVKGVVIKGITPERLERMKPQIVEWAEPLLLKQGAEGGGTPLPGVFVGQELAIEMRIQPGDQVSIVSPTESEGIAGVPRLKRFVVEGIYHSGMAEQEIHTLFARDTAVRSYVRRAGVWSQWEVTLSNLDQAQGVADRLRSQLPKFQVLDWRQLNAHLFASLKLERLAMFVILIFIVVVASFNIVTTLTLMVLEKTRDISILKAMGANNRQVAGVFLWEGLFIGAGGVGGGLVLGALICLGLKRYELNLPDIYYDRTLPVTFDPKYYALIACSAVIIVLVACFYPSRRAARMHPLQGIRLG